ncbi:hypothetical protein [Gorillibacterium sp. sgz5001074]|uniref:hypothetical protein n=1 Tax=Gorillibacterium sp. sgz5001074 TaxID=3446695 RepID=UPI003F68139B
MPPVTGVISDKRKGGISRLFMQTAIIGLLDQGLSSNEIARAFQMDLADISLRRDAIGLKDTRRGCGL